MWTLSAPSKTRNWEWVMEIRSELGTLVREQASLDLCVWVKNMFSALQPSISKHPVLYLGTYIFFSQ